MKYSLLLAGILFCLTNISVLGQDSLRHKFKTPLQNPYKNIKTSVFVQTGVAAPLGRSLNAGMEVRRFFSLKEYVYLALSYGQWTQNKDRIKNDVYQNCAYYLNSRTITMRGGVGIFGNSNLIVGAHYLMDAQLKEKVPSALDPDENIFLNGDITSYTRDIIPFFGYSFRIKLWQILFLDIGGEAWLLQAKIFQPLEGNWRVPDNISPLLSEDYGSAINGYISLHFKL